MTATPLTETSRTIRPLIVTSVAIEHHMRAAHQLRRAVIRMPQGLGWLCCCCAG